MNEQESLGSASPGDDAQRLYLVFLARRKAGEDLDLDAFVDQHPEVAEELREIHKGCDDWYSREIDLLKKCLEMSGTEDPPRVLGDFRIIRKIASGGMATVYEAKQISMGRRVALKILPPHLAASEKAVKRFQREAQAGGRQSHPGIVTIFSMGEHEGVSYIAEELVEDGTTLADNLEKFRKDKKLPKGYCREAAQVVAEVADALMYAHQSQVIHRDVKPSNILMTREGKPKVGDFGLAKVEDALSLSRTGDFAGTPFYMSPEQALSRRIGIDSRTDIYSLGVTLYETITLKRPFEGKTSHEVLKQIIFHEPSDPCRLNPRVPRDLANICLKAMEKEPKHRYQIMSDFADDLRRYLNGEMVHAKPIPLPARFMKRVKRHPVISTAILVVVCALLSVAGVALWSQSRLEAEREVKNAIAAFMMQLFSSPDPDWMGRDVKVVEVLDKKADEIDRAFPDQPVIQAELHKVIGDTYEGLGLHESAEKQFRTALEIRREQFGAMDHRTLQVQFKLAQALMGQGKLPEAEGFIPDVLESWNEDPGDAHEDTLSVKNALAHTLWKKGDLVAAERLYQEVLKKRSSLLSADHIDTLRTKHDLAALISERGRHVEAASLQTSVLEDRKRILGNDHTDTLLTMNSLGVTCRRMGEFDDAEVLLLQALDSQKRVLSKQHTHTLATMNNLARLFEDTGRLDEAIELRREVVDNGLEFLGSSHPLTLQWENNLASLLFRKGDLLEAETLLIQVRDTMRSNPDTVYPERFNWLYNLLECHMRQGRFAEAEKLSHEILNDCRECLSEDDPLFIHTVVQLSLACMKTGKHPKAGKLLKDAVERAQETLPIENDDRILLHNFYAQCLFEQELFEEAIEQTRACYEGLKTKKSEHADAALSRLITVCTMAGKKDLAEKYRFLRKNSGNSADE